MNQVMKARISVDVRRFLMGDIIPQEDLLIENPETIHNKLESNEYCFYKVNQLSFDEEYPHREAFENVILSLNNSAFNFVYILSGDENGISLYIGVVKNQHENMSVLGQKLNAVNYGEIIAKVFEGNFGGSELERLKGERLSKAAFRDTEAYKNAGLIMGIPSINKDDKTESKYGFQGIDRLINSMLGLRWRMVIVCEPATEEELVQQKNNIYNLYNELNAYAKSSIQNSKNTSTSNTQGYSKTTGSNIGFTKSDTKGTSSGNQSSSHNDSKSSSKTEGSSEGKSKSNTQNSSASTSHGDSSAVTIEIVNKKAQEVLKYLDEELLDRFKRGTSKGMFRTSVYYMADKPTDANRLKVGIISLFQGNKSTYSPLRSVRLDMNGMKNLNVLQTYQSQYVDDKDYPDKWLILMSRPFDDTRLWLNTYLTTDEVSLIAGLPQKEVPGISVNEGVDYGLNFKNLEGEIKLGTLMKKSRNLHNMPIRIERAVLNKHVFIAGVTGSGKTTTCHKLLKEAHMPFLVIEPVKAEYRALLRSYELKNLIVFTVGDEQTAPFRLNPFELIPGEMVASHIDMLKATFTSAFPMEAAMPQILEEAIYSCYEDKGWDVVTNKNRKCMSNLDYLPGDEYSDKYDVFPNFNDLLDKMGEVVDSKGFGERLGSEYRGSLIARFSNLTKGIKGAVINCRQSIDFCDLAERNVVIELENMKSPEDKSLLMGFILTRLSAVIHNKHKKNPAYRHLTLIEEAHRLLSKTEYIDNGAKKSAVETFTDLLAEVRKYGEGLIVVDQIPNKLAPEVLKNTNTKIIHKLFARDDKEAVGDTMLMDDKQKAYLSDLHPGEAIIFTEGTPKPIHIKVDRITMTEDEEISDELVHKNYMKYYADIYMQNRAIQELYPTFMYMLKILNHGFHASGCLTTTAKQAIEQFRKNVKCFSESVAAESEISMAKIAEVLAKENRKRHQKDELNCERLCELLRIILTIKMPIQEDITKKTEVITFLRHMVDN